MATTSRIGMELPDGSVRSIYCHWDGYPTHTGRILVDHYSDREKLENLLELGNISLLEKEVYPDPRFDHSYDSSQSEVTVAYHRDRGEAFEPAQKSSNARSYFNNYGHSYAYLFTKEGEWCYVSSSNKNPTRLN